MAKRASTSSKKASTTQKKTSKKASTKSSKKSTSTKGKKKAKASTKKTKTRSKAVSKKEKAPKKAKVFRPNPKVDKVIQLPKDWERKPHRNKILYFIPEWDDLVDPDYDFETDTHWGGRGDWSNEVYAHQMFPEPNYDGLLISKVVAEKSKKKKERINQMGVHRFLRVPRNMPIMGDCGAFGYIDEDVPPYSIDEILDYYTRLDFDYGVSIDHLIVKATEEQKKFRYDLTIHNAEIFLKEHKKRGLTWEPIGAVQGWDPDSYAKAAEQYVKMGYKYIALGGLVRTNTTKILELLQKVHEVVPSDVKLHLFGIARLNGLLDFARFGVTSVDSTSYLRRAWLGAGQNYLTHDGEMFSAIRIPEAGKSFRAKRIVQEGRATLETIQKLEHNCLAAMKAFDKGELNVEQTLEILGEYDALITEDRKGTIPLLRKTLEASPWKHCPCAICKEYGVQVIIFRGNNRNRRRGFHNTHAFYRLFQQVLNGEAPNLPTRSNKSAKPEKEKQVKTTQIKVNTKKKTKKKTTKKTKTKSKVKKATKKAKTKVTQKTKSVTKKKAKGASKTNSATQSSTQQMSLFRESQ